MFVSNYFLFMWSFIWHTFFFDPIYNLLVFFIDVFPLGDVGLAIIATTIVVKCILLPLSVKATKTQVRMKELQPKLEALKETHKDNREAQAREMLELYKEAGVNPFASILLIFLQVPIIIALYFAVTRGGGVPLPDINIDLLYAFIPQPDTVSTMLFGWFDILGKSLPLALLAAGAQFVHGRLSMAALPTPDKDAAPSFKNDFQKSMQLQIKWVLPVVIFFVAYTISAAVALYFTVSNLFAIAQEYYLRRHR